MVKFPLWSVMSACVVAVSLPASAGSTDTLTQKNGWVAYERGLDAKVDAVNAACGAKLTGDYDKATYPDDFDPMTDRTQSACEQAVDTLGPICSTPAGKAAVKALSAVSCRLSAKGTGARVSGGVLTIAVDPVHSSITGDKPGSYSWKSAIEEQL